MRKSLTGAYRSLFPRMFLLISDNKMFPCDRCKFVAKNKGGLTMHKKSHIQEDYQSLSVTTKESQLLAMALDGYNKDVRESKVILDLAYKMDKLQDAYEELKMAREPAIEMDSDRTFLQKRYSLALSFLGEYRLNMTRFFNMDEEYANFGQVYGFPCLIILYNGVDYVKIDGIGLPERMSGDVPSERVFKIQFQLYTKNSAMLKFGDRIHLFNEIAINGHRIYLPIIKDFNITTHNVNAFISMTYMNSLF